MKSPAKTLRRFALFPLVMAGLSACGGGGGGDDTPPTGTEVTGPSVGTYTEISDTSATTNSDLTYAQITNGGAGSDGSAGTLDHDAGTITGGPLAGTVSVDLTTIALAGGGTANLSNPANTEYLRIFTTEGTANSQFGVVGQATISADIPTSGTANYYGRVEMQAADGSTNYVLDGTATITARWNDDQVDTAFTNLSGTTNGGAPVGNVGTLTVNNAAMAANGRFAGGAASGTGAFSGLTGSENLAGTAGYFFGTNADEVGGTVVVDDTAAAAGSLSIIAVYAAE